MPADSYKKAQLQKSRNEVLRNIPPASLSAAIAVGLMNPLDCLRIRWQVAPETSKSFMGFAKRIVQQEGIIRGLALPGLVPNVVSVALNSGVRNGLYPVLRDSFAVSYGGGEKSPAAMAVSGFVAGGVGYWTSCPLFQMKVRLQTDAGKVIDGLLVTGARRGLSPAYSGTLNGLMSIIRTEGALQLYRGASALIVRGAFHTMGQTGGYDYTKTTCKKAGVMDGPALHLLAAMSGAFWATVCSAPLDILVTRFQSGPMVGKHYSGLLDCAQSMVREEGLSVFFRGWPVFFARVAPITIIMWPMYEQLRRLMGLEYLD